MRSIRAGLGIFALLTSLLGSSLLAQSGVIRGTVVDEQGKPLNDAEVRIEGLNIGRNYKVKTDKNGEFMHIGVSFQGNYRVIAKKEGYFRDYVDGVRPAPDREGPTTDFVLKVGDHNRKLAFELTQAEIDQARKDAADAEKQEEDRSALEGAFDAGVEAFNSGQFAVAIQQFQAAAKLDPEQPNIWGNLGRAYARLGQNDKSVESYLKAIELKPDEVAFHQNLAGVYSLMGNSAEAQRHNSKAIELAAASDPAAAAATYYNMAVPHINASRNTQAKELLEKALQSDPNHPDANYQMALVLLNLNQIAECKKYLQKYLDVTPDKEGEFALTAKELLKSL